MRKLTAVRQKLYYIYARAKAGGRAAVMPPRLLEKSGLFIYFDYEREFGGSPVTRDDNHLSVILDRLDEYGIKSTWFTVGLIFRHYPASVMEISGRGHEIASHTCGHIIPLKASAKALRKDFSDFSNASAAFGRPAGFHSPNGRWSLGGLREMVRHDYRYDLVTCRARQAVSPLLVRAGSNASVLRFCSLGDDWPLHRRNKTPEQFCHYYLELLGKLKPGTIYGIGFHPWIIASDVAIREGFVLFLEKLRNRHDICLNTAGGFALEILANNDQP